MFDLGHMSLSDVTACSAELRRLGQDARSMEEVAQRVVRYLYDQIGDAAGKTRACALVRFYKTHNFGELPAELRAFASGIREEGELYLETKCLTLLATAGDEPHWNERSSSASHQAIPLPSPQVVAQLPMVAQLVRQLGIEVKSLLSPDTQLLVDNQQRTFNVFYVQQALGSPYIPAQQEFVVPYRIASVLGFGGLLPNGELFAVIMFSRVPIPPGTADLFKPLALSTKLALLPFVNRPIFA